MTETMFQMVIVCQIMPLLSKLVRGDTDHIPNQSPQEGMTMVSRGLCIWRGAAAATAARAAVGQRAHTLLSNQKPRS